MEIVNKYLGIDENITYNDPRNEEEVFKKYLNRIRKIWPPELPDLK